MYQEKIYTQQMQCHLCSFLKLEKIIEFWNLYTLLVLIYQRGTQGKFYFRKKPLKTLPILEYLKCTKMIGQLPKSCRKNIRKDIVPRKQNCNTYYSAAICSKLSKMKDMTELKILKTRSNQLFYSPRISKNFEQYVYRGRHEKFRSANQRKLQYLKVGADILDEVGNAFLVLIKYNCHLLRHTSTNCKILNRTSSILQYPWILLIANNIPFTSYGCLQYYNKYGITLSTCSPKCHRSNDMVKKIPCGIKSEGTDNRDLLREHNSTPITGLHTSLAQILFSQCIRARMTVTTAMMQSVIQKGVYDSLKARQDKFKLFYDRLAQTKEAIFEESDGVVTKTGNEKFWEPGPTWSAKTAGEG
ncbi:hypothetical protein PR048_026486 [Dryococelus australis]|uniref:Uncharacterized protein n=1 Tax=Dryococelus australis TaxID=614101 RepID=A0ABQ9GLI1_9NEOP|nr:hypothetical protein PR048_026486 [Dryococelus australis]